MNYFIAFQDIFGLFLSVSMSPLKAINPLGGRVKLHEQENRLRRALGQNFPPAKCEKESKKVDVPEKMGNLIS